jgi:outer membrane biosynthesis protein TonB
LRPPDLTQAKSAAYNWPAVKEERLAFDTFSLSSHPIPKSATARLLRLTKLRDSVYKPAVAETRFAAQETGRHLEEGPMNFRIDDDAEDNELPRFDDEEEAGGGEEDVEEETEELIVEERPSYAAAPSTPARPAAKKAASKPKAQPKAKPKAKPKKKAAPKKKAKKAAKKAAKRGGKKRRR